jgi:hypothetical protein
MHQRPMTSDIGLLSGKLSFGESHLARRHAFGFKTLGSRRESLPTRCPFSVVDFNSARYRGKAQPIRARAAEDRLDLGLDVWD